MNRTLGLAALGLSGAAVLLLLARRSMAAQDPGSPRVGDHIFVSTRIFPEYAKGDGGIAVYSLRLVVTGLSSNRVQGRILGAVSPFGEAPVRPDLPTVSVDRANILRVERKS